MIDRHVTTSRDLRQRVPFSVLKLFAVLFISPTALAQQDSPCQPAGQPPVVSAWFPLPPLAVPQDVVDPTIAFDHRGYLHIAYSDSASAGVGLRLVVKRYNPTTGAWDPVGTYASLARANETRLAFWPSSSSHIPFNAPMAVHYDYADGQKLGIWYFGPPANNLAGPHAWFTLPSPPYPNVVPALPTPCLDDQGQPSIDCQSHFPKIAFDAQGRIVAAFEDSIPGPNGGYAGRTSVVRAAWNPTGGAAGSGEWQGEITGNSYWDSLGGRGFSNNLQSTPFVALQGGATTWQSLAISSTGRIFVAFGEEAYGTTTQDGRPVAAWYDESSQPTKWVRLGKPTFNSGAITSDDVQGFAFGLNNDDIPHAAWTKYNEVARVRAYNRKEDSWVPIGQDLPGCSNWGDSAHRQSISLKFSSSNFPFVCYRTKIGACTTANNEPGQARVFKYYRIHPHSTPQIPLDNTWEDQMFPSPAQGEDHLYPTMAMGPCLNDPTGPREVPYVLIRKVVGGVGATLEVHYLH